MPGLMAGGGPVVGRERELSFLGRVLEEGGPRVCFVHAIAGMGKTALLEAFADRCAARGVDAWRVDCGAVDPTEGGFLAALAAAGWDGHESGVVVVDTYEVFRIADPWLRQDLVPSLPAGVRFVIAGRDPPMLEWSADRGRVGGLEVLPLGPLDDGAARALLAQAGMTAVDIEQVVSLTRGVPLGLALAVEADLAGVGGAELGPHVVDGLATTFRAGLAPAERSVLDAASVPRRVTRGVLAAMLGEPAGSAGAGEGGGGIGGPGMDADGGMEWLAGLGFVTRTAEGLRLHDAVQAAVSAHLRAVDPDQFRALRAAAWRHTQVASHSTGAHELSRTTADLLFLIDNPVVREAMFPTTAHEHSVERSRPDDHPGLRALWEAHDTATGAAALDAWLRHRPEAVRAIRDRSGALVGCSIVEEWRNIPPVLERDDPVVASWSHHAARHPLPPGQRTLVHRRVLSTAGEGPSPAQGAAWLDLKRDYFRMRPRLGRLYTGIHDPAPFLDALLTLGFVPFPDPIDLGGRAFHLASLDFGPDSIDGWLRRLAAAELGVVEERFLDPGDRTVDVGGRRVALSPLEFGVLGALEARAGAPVSRADLLAEVWGTTYDGGSNTVDVVVRGLRKKLGALAARVETVRGVGYRLR